MNVMRQKIVFKVCLYIVWDTLLRVHIDIYIIIMKTQVLELLVAQFSINFREIYKID